MRHARTIILFLFSAVLLGCDTRDTRARREESSAPSSGSVSGGDEASRAERAPFSDVTDEVGLDFVHTNGMTGERYFVEMMGSGGAFVDYDNDGDLDVYIVQGRSLAKVPNDISGSLEDRLYRNDLEPGSDGGAGAFRFTDVTDESGLEAPGYGMGVATGDFNNDGWVDLYVTNWGSNQLWRNEGDGTFTDVTEESGTDDSRWSSGAAFVDFDLDGWLDLIVVNYVTYALETDQPCYGQTGVRDYCSPDAYPPAQDRLFRNRGDGTFEDVTLRMGLAAAYGPALGVITADFDLDGWLDIYVTNDGQENQLWINQGGRRFENRAVLAGAAVNAAGMAEASMGVAAADYDGDGDEDLFMTHLLGETNTFYVNVGGALFEDRTRRSGLGLPSRVYTGFGIAPLDYDNDGWLDLFIANGEVKVIPEQVEQGDPLPLRQGNQLYRNLGQGRFREVTPRDDEVFGLEEVGRGIAYGDVDNDGDTDVLLTNNNGPARLLRNDVGRENRWLGLRLAGTPGRRDMLGTRVAVGRSAAPTLWRRVHVDGSYCSAHDPRVLIGLGATGAYEVVRVYWPGGKVEEWDGLGIDEYHTLIEGQGRPADTS